MNFKSLTGTLRLAGFIATGAVLLATGGCAITNLLNPLLQRFIPTTM